tara:strand:- start:2887 stop:3081 length:195 start_codon:yes stop_codon:yes gene_type:complete
VEPLDVEEAEVARLEAFAREVDKGKVVGNRVRMQLADDCTLPFFLGYQPMNIQWIETFWCLAVY